MTSFETLLKSISAEPIYLVKTATSYTHYTPLDLSSENKELLTFDINNTVLFEAYLDSLMSDFSTVAYGGYLEKRSLYKRSTSFFTQDPKEERNIHLGVDFWCAENTPVLAALDGHVHSYANNEGLGNYGPTIILKHNYEGIVFYTLYGHLTKSSITGLQKGLEVKQGTPIAAIGGAHENGHYAPHLHFQIIHDLEGAVGDFKGVTSLNSLVKDKTNCPDPKLLLKYE